MHLYYGRTRAETMGDRVFRNARFYVAPEAGARSVVVDGDWPHIVADYAAMRVPVEILSGEPERPARTVEPNMFTNVLTADERAAVEIPDGWRDLPWTRPAEEGGITLRGLGAKFSSGVLNREQAIAAVEAELERRANSLEMMRDPGPDVKTFAGEA